MSASTACSIEPDELVRVLPKADWSAPDSERTANATPASMGLARAAVDRLAVTAERRGSRAAGELAQELAARLVVVRRAAYALADEAPPAARVPERLALRAEALDLAQRAAAAVVAAEAGRAMLLDVTRAAVGARGALPPGAGADRAAAEELLDRWRRQIRPA